MSKVKSSLYQWQDEKNVACAEHKKFGRRKVCYVDGNPHENRSVILSVLGFSHPLDVHEVHRQECNKPTTLSLTNHFHAARHSNRNYWTPFKWIPGATPGEAWQLVRWAQDVHTGSARDGRYVSFTKLKFE